MVGKEQCKQKLYMYIETKMVCEVIYLIVHLIFIFSPHAISVKLWANLSISLQFFGQDIKMYSRISETCKAH